MFQPKNSQMMVLRSSTNSIPLPFIPKPQSDPSLHNSDDDSSHTRADSEHLCVAPEQPPVPICIYGTPHCDNHLAGKPISNQYFHIFDNEIDQ